MTLKLGLFRASERTGGKEEKRADSKKLPSLIRK
jgi:hypothetical protein